MPDGFSIPNPPWLVCKDGESRIFELCSCGQKGFEMRILDANHTVVLSRRFKTRRLAIEWGFEEQSVLRFDGWKHPYDAAVDEVVEDGVGNWNRWVLTGRGKRFPMWQAMMQVPEARRAADKYAGAPYLGLVTIDEIYARFRILAISLMDVGTDGLCQPAAWGKWHDKWVHTATEILLRDLSLDDERCRADWSFLGSAPLRRAVSAYSRRRPSWGDKLLVKYGSAQYLRSGLKYGTFRISPANSYNDPSLNAARRDDELERLLVDTAVDTTSLFGPLAETMPPEDRALYTRPVQSVSDYYIFCLAMGWNVRLFNDFNADACLVITDPKRFIRALGEAAKGQLPDWRFCCKPVTYIDSVQDLRFLRVRTEARFAPFFCKDFRYLHQKEVRAVWLPPDPAARLDLGHIFITLGSLEEYCELIEI